MPWECKAVETTRKEFVAKAVLAEQTISELCREYGISRPTAYKWIERYKKGESLADQSHEPFCKPFKTAPEMEDVILDLRQQHPTWGPRKLGRYLCNKGVTGLPCASTIAAILKRSGCITEQASKAHTAYKRFVYSAPNELWQMDYKGHFGMLNGERCHPLTITDDHSRFNICTAAKDCERWDKTKTSIIRAFSEFGLPKSILCDNGKPWGDNKNGYTNFDVWMMQLDILPIHGSPLHPQTQGKEERYHRTLKEDLLVRTPMRDLEHAQREFDLFRSCYNYERPHGALNLDVPAKHYRASPVILPASCKEPEYDTGKRLRRVNCKGYISINRHRYFLGDSFIGKYIDLYPKTDECVVLCYGSFQIAEIDLSEKVFSSKKIYRMQL